MEIGWGSEETKEMKNVSILVVMLILITLMAGAQEGYDWITEYEWYIEMTGEGEFIYWHETPMAVFRKNTIPKDVPIYREYLWTKIFNYYYPVGKDHMVLLGYDQDKDGMNDLLNIYSRENFSVFFIEDNNGLILGGGVRQGKQDDIENPFVGIWILRSSGKIISQVSIVEPATYLFFLELEDIPGFAIRKGGYLLKQTGPNMFESDATFPDGHIRLEIKSRDLIVLTPLFTLSQDEGMLEPVYIRRVGK